MLCRRDSTYDFVANGQALNIDDEEEMIRLGAQEAPDPNKSQIQNLV
jgi:hypothetical protein